HERPREPLAHIRRSFGRRLYFNPAGKQMRPFYRVVFWQGRLSHTRPNVLQWRAGLLQCGFGLQSADNAELQILAVAVVRTTRISDRRGNVRGIVDYQTFEAFRSDSDDR